MKFGNKVGANARRSLWLDIKKIINTESPVIIDGGSNNGELIDLLLNHFKSPQIYAIEANPELSGQLSNKFSGSDNIKIVDKAIGSQNTTMRFNISNNPHSSSFLARGKSNEKYHGDTTSFKKEIDVEVVRLDTELSFLDKIDILKLDLEGYELEALKGAFGILDKVKIIVTEVEFSDMYKGAPRFSELEIFLRENNFRFLNFYDLYTNEDVQLNMGDAVFLNNNFRKL